MIGETQFSNLPMNMQIKPEEEEYIFESVEDPRDCSMKIQFHLRLLLADTENNFIESVRENPVFDRLYITPNFLQNFDFQDIVDF